MAKLPYTFRFEETLIEDQLKPIALKENRPLTNLMENIFLDYLARLKKSKARKK